MIRIKDFISNENDIVFISESDDNELHIMLKNDFDFYVDGTFKDIEWNYGTPQETQRQMQKELCKSCYYRDTISNKLKELEEENKKIKSRIDKAIVYIEQWRDTKTKRIDSRLKRTLEILKGE